MTYYMVFQHDFGPKKHVFTWVSASAKSIAKTDSIIGLVPSPTPSFLMLFRTASNEKLGMGLGTRLLDYRAGCYNVFTVGVDCGC